MKIGNWEVKIFKAPKIKDSEEEIGSSGTSNIKGVITGEDYIPSLSGNSALIKYDEMRKSDGVVKAAVMACELPIRAANWYVAPASDDPKDVEVADFVSQCLFENMTITWDDFLRQALLMLPFGFSVFEKVFQSVKFNGKDMIGWRKFAPRLQKTIQKWETQEGQDGITQMSYLGAETVSIPIEKLLIFTYQKEGDNWLGISVLRSAYRPWFWKNHIEKIHAIAFERQGLGIPYGKLPASFTQKDRDKMEGMLKNIRANQQQYAILKDGWEMGFMDMKAGTLMDPSETVRRYNREILISVLAQFLDLGSGQTGSRALSADHSSTFHNNLTAVAKTVQDVMNKYAIKQLVDLNYTVAKYPTLEYSYIGLPRYKEVSEALSQLIAQGAVIPDEKLEDHLRQLMSLPKRPEIKEKQTPSTDKPKEEELKSEADQKKQNSEKIKASEFAGWRPLTFAEKKVNLVDISRRMDKASDELRKDLSEIITKSVEDLIRQFQLVMEASTSTEKRNRINNIAVKYLGEYRRALYNSIYDNFEYGKTMAAHEMKKDVPASPASSIQLMSKLADGLTQTMADDLIREGKLALLVGLQKHQFSETVDRIIKVLKSTGKNIAMNASILNVSSAISQGRRATFSIYGSDIYALQRSEILDSVTCNYCMSIDSRIFRKNDSFSKVDAVHSNCRGIWVEIMKEEVEKPPITGIPRALRESFETTNVFEPPKHPIIKKNSPAAEFLLEKQKTMAEEKEYQEMQEARENIAKQNEQLLKLKETIESALDN